MFKKILTGLITGIIITPLFVMTGFAMTIENQGEINDSASP